MPTVLVYRSLVLPYSETFIKEQMLAYRRWRGILSGRRQMNQLPLDGLEVHSLGGKSEAITSRIVAKMRWTLGRPPGLSPLRRQDIRLVHAHFGPDGIEAAVIAKRFGVPLLVTLHGYDIYVRREWFEAGRGRKDLTRYPDQLLALAGSPSVHFIAVSDNIKAQAIRVGIAPEKLTTRYIGIDLTRFRPGPVPVAARPPRVLFVGRLVEKKGCEYLLRAMRQVQDHVPEASLSIIGDGVLRKELEALAHELQIRVCFHGSLPSDAVRRAFEEARVCCQPSVRATSGDAEGLPIVTLESQACGVPVITSACGGATEGIADGITGYAFEEKAVDALAAHLIELFRDDAKVTAMSQAALQFVRERFDIRKTTAELESTYDRISGASLA